MHSCNIKLISSWHWSLTGLVYLCYWRVICRLIILSRCVDKQFSQHLWLITYLASSSSVNFKGHLACHEDLHCIGRLTVVCIRFMLPLLTFDVVMLTLTHVNENWSIVIAYCSYRTKGHVTPSHRMTEDNTKGKTKKRTRKDDRTTSYTLPENDAIVHFSFIHRVTVTAPPPPPLDGDSYVQRSIWTLQSFKMTN